jgi:quercetin dioxygenase-like cupin family protein
MKYTRIYADAHGESHFEDVEVGMKQAPYNAGTISEMIAAKGVMFRLSGEYFIDWHNAPRRQFVVNLTGTVEIMASDGEKRRLGPGSILLAEDLIGKGHTSRGRGGEERLSLFVPLAD